MTNGNEGHKDWKAEGREKQLDLADKLLSSFHAELDAKGINEKYLAFQLKKKAGAKSVRHIKIKGSVDPDALPRGYSVVGSTMVDIVTENGIETVVGETLIEYTGPDHGTNLKTLQILLKILNLQGSDKVEQKLTGSVIHVHTHTPEPDPVPTEFMEPETQ